MECYGSCELRGMSDQGTFEGCASNERISNGCFEAHLDPTKISEETPPERLRVRR